MARTTTRSTPTAAGTTGTESHVGDAVDRDAVDALVKNSGNASNG